MARMNFKEWLQSDTGDTDIDAYGDYCAEYKEPEQKSDFHYLGFAPESGETIYAVDETGSVFNCKKQHDHCLVFDNALFETQEEGEYHRDMLKLAHEVKKLSFQPDWSDSNQEKHCLSFGHRNSTIFGDCTSSHESSQTNFRTRETALQAGKLFPDNAAFLYCFHKGLI